MMTQTSDELAIQELFSKITVSRQLTRIDFNLLTLALLSNSLDEEEVNAIKRIFYAIRRGWLKLVDISEEPESWMPACRELLTIERLAS